MAYDCLVDDYATVMTVLDFYQAVKAGAYIDYDGFGYPAQDPKCFPWKRQGEMLMDGSKRIRPSQVEMIPTDATHIVWFNR